MGAVLVQGLWCLVACRQKAQEAQKSPEDLFMTLKAGAFFHFVMISLAMAALITAYVKTDFSLKNVFENAHTQTPLIYRITGAWGNHEGSMLLWLWLMALYGLLSTKGPLNQDAWSFAVLKQVLYQGLFVITVLYVFFLSNPFESFKGFVSQGLELNPILQDPALAIHPPLLYSGYVGFAVVYASALAGALSGVRSQIWLQDVQRWTRIAWSFLTLGIALGSWWAYYELGWGGWWFWDPVENASLMPWLSSTALLHLVIPSRYQGHLLKNTYFMGVLTFTLCLLGTFLVRSGSLSSVHAFAQDPGRGIAIFSLTLVVGMGGVWGFVSLVRSRVRKPLPSELISLPGFFSLQSLLLMTLLVTVLLGTLYPLFIEGVTGKALSVGAPYFQKTFVPLSFVLFGFMGLSAFLRNDSKSLSLKALYQRAERPLVLTILCMMMWSFFVEPLTFLGVSGFGAACWVTLSSFHALTRQTKDRHKKLASFLAHVGVAILIFGMTGDHTFKQEKTVALSVGEKVTFQGYDILLRQISRHQQDTYKSERALVEVRQNKRLVASLTPEKRFYPSHQVLTTETALYPHGLSNLYIALGGVLPNEKWTLRLYHHPFVLCLWIGAILMALGGILPFLLRFKRNPLLLLFRRGILSNA